MKCIDLMKHKLNQFVCYFFIYSFIGWCIETVYMSMKSGSFASRGFLNGPFCPVYGFAALILITLFSTHKSNPLVLFFYTALLASVLEFATSLLLQTVFHAQLWDYSSEFLNIQGRVCLKFSIVWGAIAVFILNFVHPNLQRLLSNSPINIRIALSYFIVFYFVCDFLITAISASPLSGKLPDFSLLHRF